MEVVLHIYDLSGGLAKQMSMAMVGKQVRPPMRPVFFHCGCDLISLGEATNDVCGSRLHKVVFGKSEVDRRFTCSLMEYGTLAWLFLERSSSSAAASSKVRLGEHLMASLFRSSPWAQHTYPKT